MPASSPPTRAVGSSPGGGAWRLVVSVGLLAAVWWPAWPGVPDGFPLSTYPMFGYPRGPNSVVHTVLGVRADGGYRPLTPRLVGGTAHAKHALSTARNAVLQGRTEPLCRAVVQRVAATPLAAQVVAVEVVTDTWATLGSRERGATPTQRRVHARCELP